MQLLESNDSKLLTKIKASEDVMRMVQEISERDAQSDGEGTDSEDGEGEVIVLARRCLDIIDGDGDGSKKTLVEG